MLTLDSQILSTELQKSKDMLERFAYNCSHSIRSPIKSLAGIVILMKDYPDARLRNEESYVPFIRTCVGKMEDVLVQFEELRENAITPFRWRSVNIRGFFKTITKAHRAGLEAYKISVSFHINQKGSFYSDKKRLQMIFTRLISNAISFADLTRKQREINIFTTASSSGCHIRIHDNGIGIPPSEQSRIFDLFYRGSVQSTGTGMGLFIASEVARSLGGALAVEPNEKVGSSFSVWIPNMRENVWPASTPGPSLNGSLRMPFLSLDSQKEKGVGLETANHMGMIRELDHANTHTQMFIRNYVLRMRRPVQRLSRFVREPENETDYFSSVRGIEKILVEMDDILTGLLAELSDCRTLTPCVR